MTAAQRLLVARRVAAVALLCRRPIIDLTIGIPTADDRLGLNDLAGGREEYEGVTVDVSAATLREMFDSGLFDGRGPSQLGCAHQSYAEYLAATYLAWRAAAPQLLPLITDATPGGARVVPQLHGLAAWLITLRPELADALIENDPGVGLAADLAAGGDGFRARLAASILGRAGVGRFHDHGPGLADRYRRLAHPALAEQLQPVLRDRQAHWLLRRVAIDIAEACVVVELLADLTTLALDPVESHVARVQAAHAVVAFGPEAAEHLRPCASNNAGNDPDDDLKGIALRALFPARLEAATVFATLHRPLRDNYFGQYRWFLQSELPTQLGPEHLQAALAWLERQDSRLGCDLTSSDLVTRILTLSWDHCVQPEVMANYARVVQGRLRVHEPISGLPGPDERRRQLFEDVFPAVRAERGRLRRFDLGPILTTADVGYLLDRAARADEPALRDDLAWLADDLLGYEPEATALLLRAVAACPRYGKSSPHGLIRSDWTRRRPSASARRTAN